MRTKDEATAAQRARMAGAQIDRPGTIKRRRSRLPKPQCLITNETQCRAVGRVQQAYAAINQHHHCECGIGTEAQERPMIYKQVELTMMCLLYGQNLK